MKMRLMNMKSNKNINWKRMFVDGHRYNIRDNESGLSIDGIYRENINPVNYSEFIMFEIAGEAWLQSTMSVDITKVTIISRKTSAFFNTKSVMDLINNPYNHQIKFKYNPIDINNEFGLNTAGYRYDCGCNTHHIINSVDIDTMSLDVTLFVEKHPSVCVGGINKEQFIEKHGLCDEDNSTRTKRQPVQTRIPLAYIIEENNAPVILPVAQKESTRLFYYNH